MYLPFAAAFALLLSSCAYNYAAEQNEGETTSERQQSSKVVTLKEGPEETQPPKPVTPPEMESPCGVEQFTIYFFDSTSQIEKKIDCTTKKVVDTKQSKVDAALFKSQQNDNLPPGTWYLLVDPAGANISYISNQSLLKLSQQFQIEFFGRHESKNLLVYSYLESVK